MVHHPWGTFFKHCLFLRSVFGHWEGAVAGKDGETQRRIHLSAQNTKEEWVIHYELNWRHCRSLGTHCSTDGNCNRNCLCPPFINLQKQNEIILANYQICWSTHSEIQKLETKD